MLHTHKFNVEILTYTHLRILHQLISRCIDIFAGAAAVAITISVSTLY